MMRRRDFRPWAGLALSLAVLGYVGCTSSSPTDSSKASPAGGGPAGTGGADRSSGGSSDGEGLASMGNPAAVLIISGEMDGYLEPCGCTQGQVGGLLRRYDFVERVHERNWPTALIDLGGLTKDPAVARGGFEQAKYKFDHAVKALKLLDYSAIALSAEDMKFGVLESLGLLLNSLGEKTKIVAANVAAPAGFESMFRTSVIVPAGKVKVGVTAVIDPEALKSLNDPDKEMLTAGLKDPGAVLPGVLAELEPKTDYQVLMVQGPPAMARSLAEAYPGFDIVVSTSEYDDVLKHDADRLNGDKTVLVQVGKKGKYVGVFGLYPGEPERLRYRVMTLGTRFNGPATAMKKLVEDEYRGFLRQSDVVKNFSRHDNINGAPGAIYVGAENCKACHPNTYMRWSTTKHAHAFDSLLHEKRPDTIYDAECVTCHTTGFEYNSGWKSEAETPYLKGNQCENCHGPGSKHVAEPKNLDYRKAMALTPEKADKNQLCQHCHDGDNSPKFDFASYYPRIAHKGLDDYKDPKVLIGITPRLTASDRAAAASGTAR